MRRRGGPRSLTPEQEKQVLSMYSETMIPVSRIAEAFGVCRKTIYNTLDRARGLSPTTTLSPEKATATDS
jgi:transposase-like protein